VWLTSEGTAVPVYPWEPGRWERRTAEAVAEKLLPDWNNTWSIDTPAGVESVLLLARAEPLPERLLAQMPGRLAGFPRLLSLPDPGRVFWFECRPGDDDAATRKRLNVHADPIRDPLLLMDLFLREKLGGVFDVIRAMSFASSGS
jgi:hypothetical protein